MGQARGISKWQDLILKDHKVVGQQITLNSICQNMKRVATIIVVIIIVASVSASQGNKGLEAPASDKQGSNRFGLPSSAVIIEEQPLESESHPDRTLILWMVNPTRNPSDAQKDPEEPYTCPDQTRGSCYSGPVRVSLLDTTTRTVI